MAIGESPDVTSGRDNSKVKIIKNKIIFAIILICLGILSRTIWHLGPNVEFVTGSTLLSGAYLGLGWAIIVPFSIMFITDFLIGNTNIFLFTWSAYLVIGCLGYLSHKGDLRMEPKILWATGLGIGASIWFYLWTNFGVWLLDSWGMYPKTMEGLVSAYILGLPFLKYNLLGNLFLIPASFFIVEVALSLRVSLLARRGNLLQNGK